MHNLPFKINRTRANEILNIVHTDSNGPHSNIGYDGSKYFLTFLDDYSKCSIVYAIKSKTEVYNCFIDYINEVENYTGKKIRTLRCDNGTEYIINEIFNLIREKGIILDRCPPYVHELNGTAERFNRTIMNSARCLIAEAKIDIRYWPEVILTASYLKNRTIANTIENKSPYEIFFGKRPNIENLKLYGSKVFFRVPESKINTKWDRKADCGILVGYEKVGYRVLFENKIIVARHVDIVEKDEILVGFNEENESENESEFESEIDQTRNDPLVTKNESPINYKQKIPSNDTDENVDSL